MLVSLIQSNFTSFGSGVHVPEWGINLNNRGFSFSLDPGTGPTAVEGVLEGLRLTLTVRTPSSTRTETRILPEAPALAMNLPRRLAAEGLAPTAAPQTVAAPVTAASD